MLPYLLGGGIALAAYHAYSKYSYRPSPFSLDIASSELKSTIILPDLAERMPEEKNAIWCLTSELAWKRAMDEYFGGPLRLREARPLLERMNATRANWDGLPAELCHCRTRRFSPEHFQVFISLLLNLHFDLPFYQLEGGVTFNRYDKVKAFGIPPGRTAPARLCKQVQVLYSEGNEFIIDPCRTSRPFQLILATVKKEATLGQTIEASEARCTRATPRTLSSKSSLLIPEQSWRLRHHFEDLSGVFATEAQDLRLRMDQELQFRLDRCGARLLSNVRFLGVVLCAPKDYHFAHPFLLYMKARHNGQIIFAQWIENSELLVPY